MQISSTPPPLHNSLPLFLKNMDSLAYLADVLNLQHKLGKGSDKLKC